VAQLPIADNWNQTSANPWEWYFIGADNNRVAGRDYRIGGISYFFDAGGTMAYGLRWIGNHPNGAPILLYATTRGLAAQTGNPIGVMY
jgi:hypothetical protein